MPVCREFTNELGNRIRISVTRDVRATDLVCTACRWRAGHAPSCERAAEAWPTIPLDGNRTLIRIEGPSSVSENYLTPMEVAELLAALRRAESEAEQALWDSLEPEPLTDAQRERFIAAAARGAAHRQVVRHRIAAVVNGAMARARNEEEVFALDVADEVLKLAAVLYSDD